jgi:hypothetical protein
MIGGIGDGEFEVALLPLEAKEESQQELAEKERMEEIGRVATLLFTLLNPPQPTIPPMMNVVVINKEIPAPALKTSEEVSMEISEEASEETVQEVKVPALDIIVDTQSAEVPEEAEVETSSKPSREEIEKLVDRYQQQAHLFKEAIEHERRSLKTQEQIQLLQQLSQNSHVASSDPDPKADILKKIAHFEEEIQLIEGKITELQALHDIKG